MQELQDAEGAAAGKGKAAAKGSAGSKVSAAKPAQAPKKQKAVKASQAGKAKRKGLAVSARTSSRALLQHVYTHTMYVYPPALYYRDTSYFAAHTLPGHREGPPAVVRW